MPVIKNPNKEVSIEYAHIYTNDSISNEQEFSLKILKKLKKELDKKKKSFLLTVLVDDYSFPDPSFDYGSFTWWLGERGFKPDLVLRESQLIPLCDEVIHHIKNRKIKNQMINYIKNKKYPCSLFVASWYLLRLGYLKHVIFEEKYITPRLINILPESFKPYEDKAFEIIASTEFSEATNLIDYHFIYGRTIIEKNNPSNDIKSNQSMVATKQHSHYQLLSKKSWILVKK